jgi:hypothetical protein
VLRELAPSAWPSDASDPPALHEQLSALESTLRITTRAAGAALEVLVYEALSY